MIHASQDDGHTPTSLAALIHSGKADQACARIDEILERRASDYNHYSDLVSILLEIPDYERAKRVFACYLSETGKELVSDYSLEDIEKEEREHADAALAYEKQEPKVFTRMTIWQRGRLSSVFSLNPVTRIDISTDALTIKKRYSSGKKHHWNEIKAAAVVNKPVSHARGGKYLRRTLQISTNNDDYEIDVSVGAADFKHESIMLSELRKHIVITDNYLP